MAAQAFEKITAQWPSRTAHARRFQARPEEARTVAAPFRQYIDLLKLLPKSATAFPGSGITAVRHARLGSQVGLD